MKVRIVQYKWAGAWGPFRIKTPCGECSVTEGVIADVIAREFPGEDIEFSSLPWLDHWWKPLFAGGWHAPIVLVNGRLVAQGGVLDRGLLAYHIRKALAKSFAVPSGASVVFTKPGCGYCARAKALLKERGVAYEERNIIENPLFAHQMFAAAKREVPRGMPITTPQIWLDGRYVGGADELRSFFGAREGSPRKVARPASKASPERDAPIAGVAGEATAAS